MHARKTVEIALAPVVEVWNSKDLLPIYFKPLIWMDVMEDYPGEEPGDLIEVKEAELRGYYCPEHGQISENRAHCIDGCGFVRYSEQLNLQDDFYAIPEEEIDWNTIEGLDTNKKKMMWRKIIMRGAGPNDYQFVVREMIAARIRSLSWQTTNNQWFFQLNGRVYYKRPSLDELRIKGLYYDGLLHLIRHHGREESKNDVADKYSPYDI